MTLNINHDYEKGDDVLLVYDVLGSNVCLYEKDYYNFFIFQKR